MIGVKNAVIMDPSDYFHFAPYVFTNCPIGIREGCTRKAERPPTLTVLVRRQASRIDLISISSAFYLPHDY